MWGSSQKDTIAANKKFAVLMLSKPIVNVITRPPTGEYARNAFWPRSSILFYLTNLSLKMFQHMPTFKYTSRGHGYSKRQVAESLPRTVREHGQARAWQVLVPKAM